MNNLGKYIFSIFKTIYFNFKVFNFKTAIKLPVFISYNTKILSVSRNSIDINIDKISMAMVKFGFGGTDFIPAQKSFIKIDKGAKVKFEGRAFLGEGICVSVEKKSLITLGDNFACNKNCIIYCCKNIEVGDNVLLGWNVNLRDNDGHTIIYKNEKKENEKAIIIKDNVWIGAYVDILKGVVISKDSVVATRSCVTKEFNSPNLLIGGYPAKVIKEDVLWTK